MKFSQRTVLVHSVNGPANLTLYIRETEKSKKKNSSAILDLVCW